MSLEKILKKITDDAHEEAARIIKESRQRAEQIKKTFREESAVLAETVLKESERQTQLEISRILTQARLERNIEILSCKKEQIDLVIEKAFHKAAHGWESMNKEVIDKEGRSEEALDQKTLLDELRPKLEKFIADILKI
jgi:vacuolar-type H+-ATPase subunit H